MQEGPFLSFPYLSKKTIAFHLITKEEIKIKFITLSIAEPGPRLAPVLQVIYLPQKKSLTPLLRMSASPFHLPVKRAFKPQPSGLALMFVFCEAPMHVCAVMNVCLFF